MSAKRIVTSRRSPPEPRQRRVGDEPLDDALGDVAREEPPHPARGARLRQVLAGDRDAARREQHEERQGQGEPDAADEEGDVRRDERQRQRRGGRAARGRARRRSRRGTASPAASTTSRSAAGGRVAQEVAGRGCSPRPWRPSRRRGGSAEKGVPIEVVRPRIPAVPTKTTASREDVRAPSCPRRGPTSRRRGAMRPLVAVVVDEQPPAAVGRDHLPPLDLAELDRRRRRGRARPRAAGRRRPARSAARGRGPARRRSAGRGSRGGASRAVALAEGVAEGQALRDVAGRQQRLRGHRRVQARRPVDARDGAGEQPPGRRAGEGRADGSCDGGRRPPAQLDASAARNPPVVRRRRRAVKRQVDAERPRLAPRRSSRSIRTMRYRHGSRAVSP